MLRSLKEITGYTLQAEDGEIGSCNDFLIEDRTWTVRYMVADTRKWLPGRRVLVSPISLGSPDWKSRSFPVRLTREQIKEAPGLDEHAPATREYEIWLHKHFGWPYYWSGSGLWASAVHPRALYVAPSIREKQQSDLGDEGPDIKHPHLHAASEVLGYDILASDGEIGHVSDFILDEDEWSVRAAVAATRNWLPGKHVLVPVSRLDEVDWSEERLEVRMTREEIKKGPEYDPHKPINVELEARVYDFEGRPRS
jgi:hypothetical protein